MTLKEAALYLDAEMKKDIKAGKKWTYTNKKSMGHTFEACRSNGYYRVNCNMGVIWCCIKAGIFSQWPGNFYFNKSGALTGGSTAKKNALEKFTDLGDQNKKASDLIKNGTLKCGDIVGWHGMNHTNMYLGDGMWFDSGHANCKGSGEDAVFKCFVSSTKYGNSIVGHILRPKTPQNDKKVFYRVQVGVYKKRENAELKKQQVRDQLDLGCFISEENGEYKVFCGSFSIKENAEERRKVLVKAGIAAILKTY